MWYNFCSQFPTNTTYFFGCKTICYDGHACNGISQTPMSISKHPKNSKSYESQWLGSVIWGGGRLELWQFLNNSENWVRRKRHKIQNVPGYINRLFIEQGLSSSIVFSSATFRLPRLFNILRGVAFFPSPLAVGSFPCLSQSLPALYLSSAQASFLLHSRNFSQLYMLHHLQGRTYLPTFPLSRGFCRAMGCRWDKAKSQPF